MLTGIDTVLHYNKMSPTLHRVTFRSGASCLHLNSSDYLHMHDPLICVPCHLQQRDMYLLSMSLILHRLMVSCTCTCIQKISWSKTRGVEEVMNLTMNY